MKNFLKKWLPSSHAIKNDKSLGVVRKHLEDPALWHLNRASTAKGVAIGLFVAFIPLPGQMLIAAIISIFMRANVLVAAVMTWVTNPITFIPINLTVIKAGQIVLHDKSKYHIVPSVEFSELSVKYILTWFKSLSLPYVIGLPIVAISVSLLGYFVVKIIWSISIRMRWRNRRKKH